QPAPQRRLGVDAGDPVTVLAIAAELVPAGQAVRAGAARDDHLERHPVSGLDVPARRRPFPDLLDDPERLVTRDERGPGPAEMAPVALHVAAADAVGLHAQQPVVGPGPRPRELTELDLPRSGLDGGAHHIRHRRFLCHSWRMTPRLFLPASRSP